MDAGRGGTGLCLDANVYPNDEDGANVVGYACDPEGPAGVRSNQLWTKTIAVTPPANRDAVTLKAMLAPQQFCLTQRISIPPPPPPPPPQPPSPPQTVLFKPHDADADGVCLAGQWMPSPPPCETV